MGNTRIVNQNINASYFFKHCQNFSLTGYIAHAGKRFASTGFNFRKRFRSAFFI